MILYLLVTLLAWCKMKGKDFSEKERDKKCIEYLEVRLSCINHPAQYQQLLSFETN